jgi:hypothetical protein
MTLDVIEQRYNPISLQQKRLNTFQSMLKHFFEVEVQCEQLEVMFFSTTTSIYIYIYTFIYIYKHLYIHIYNSSILN